MRDMYSFICAGCGKPGQSSWSHTRFCSKRCRMKHDNSQYFAGSSLAREARIPTSTVGAIGELEVAVDLMKRGYHVFRALSPSAPYDLAVVHQGKAIGVEVRTARMGANQKIYGPPIHTTAEIAARIIYGHGIFYETKRPHPLDLSPEKSKGDL